MRGYALILALLMSLCMAVTSSAQERRLLTLAAYNVENMFDVFDDPYTSDETMQPKSRQAIERVAQTIREINPDVIGFAEVENEGILRAMAGEMLSDLGYKHIAVLPTNSERGIHLGVISRVPIARLTSHRFAELTLPDAPGRTWNFARDLLQITLQLTADRQMDVFMVHLKSRHDGPDDPMSADWRLAEHVKVRQVVSDLMRRDPEAWVAVMGDFNDTPDAPGILAYLAPVHGGPPLLHDVHAAPDPQRPLTYLRGRYRSVIDYILVSPSLYARLDAVDVPTNEAELLEGSDHAPVWARFNVAE